MAATSQAPTGTTPPAPQVPPPNNPFTHSEATRAPCPARPLAPTARASLPPPKTTRRASGMPPPDNPFTHSKTTTAPCLARPSAPTARASSPPPGTTPHASGLRSRATGSFASAAHASFEALHGKREIGTVFHHHII